jgi:hypothetical protein
VKAIIDVPIYCCQTLVDHATDHLGLPENLPWFSVRWVLPRIPWAQL